MLARLLKNPWSQAAIGIAIGAAFLWLAIEKAGPQEIARTIGQIRPQWLVVAMALYGIDLAIRVVRWRVLLLGVMRLPYSAVGEVLVVGYGINALLPARLGELFRVEYFKRLHNVPRVWALGSVIVERMLDGMTVVLCLLIGLLSLGRPAQSDEMVFLLVAGGLSFSLVLAAIYLFGFKVELPWIGHFRQISGQMDMLRQILKVLRSRLFAGATLLTAIIYIFETLMLGASLASVGEALTATQMLVLLGVVSLSTLMPSAPGFLGTYQFAFALTLELFARDPAHGVTVATAIQLFLFLPVGLLALLLVTRASWRRSTRRLP